MAKIAYILPYLETGGTEQHVLNLARALKDRHSITLAAPPGPLGERFAAEGIPLIPFPRFDRDLRGGWRSFRQAIAELRRQGTDIYHVHAAIELVLLTRLLGGKPLVYTVHGFFGPSAPTDYRLAALVANRAAERVICVSRIERERLVASGLKPEKAAVVWNGVPQPRTPAPAEVAAFRERFHLSPERTLIGAIGRLEKQKGLEYLIEACARLKARGLDPQLVLAGDGRERPALEQQAASLGVDSVFTGFLGEHERDAALASLDIYAMPSIGEALPLALIEAMGAGKAIVATTVGGIPEIVADGESGFLVPPRDVDSLADRLDQLSRSVDLRQSLGEVARRFHAAELTHEAMARKTEMLYRNLLNGRAPCSRDRAPGDTRR
ncbi:MAG: glycosyltransferase family 4 protein [Bacillota bacterium]|nr:glycosyltransferase family 4 protein [Bacillota bacterium]